MLVHFSAIGVGILELSQNESPNLLNQLKPTNINETVYHPEYPVYRGHLKMDGGQHSLSLSSCLYLPWPAGLFLLFMILFL